ncbi:rhodanese-like domain-containing protein [Psychrosphaera sp. 1_MG-2023]|uniref:rhodanese-like domain-containing protein n=1 Tax=Psychrosphaera sp. 1_MG-2023 TaxID=3062643 RepID=UPI0026E23BBD|nr:rhodanese-like domain-containing protein [Psychrosphaera sp. 1_MG-2023]MDO6719235.1 rhodanese-like domain-containing protein [Psychrosphaera sp. 1_MG-2023]
MKLTSLFLSLLTLFSFSSGAAYFGSLELIDAEQLNKEREKYIVLDVRTAEEFKAGHIAGAVNIPHKNISEHIETIKTWQDKTIVVHCKSGYRAGKAESVLTSNKITNMVHLDGDFDGWQDNNQPIVKD